uniref:Uncharacterized protein n=1 Tax=Meloidogyne enterolobii TaxID=390850 RepID=A0A6V7VCY3_MELEN|nr:unnamed protein product [Meloidogyne enterolobii]
MCYLFFKSLFSSLICLMFLIVFHHPLFSCETTTKLSCIKNCSEIFKHSLSSIAGVGFRTPLDMLSPLYSIIRYSANNVVVIRKSEWICLSVEKFKLCSDNCMDNRQKMVELANVGYWTNICRILVDKPKIFSEFITCQRKHLEEVGKKCKPLPLKEELTISLWQFCRIMNDYTKCYAGIKLKCSKNAIQIYRQISESINKAFERIRHISREHLLMPEECRKRISESNKIILIEKSEEEKEEIKENNNNDYWNDLINERNVTLKNNGNFFVL